ncbi:MAG: NAD-dependent epimerase/dehydratase family protein [Sphingomonadaceae bacterium]
MSPVVVTGAGGFIGRAVALALTEAGHSVRAILRQGGSVPDLPESVAVHTLPPLEQAQTELAQVSAGAGMIVHLADNPARTLTDETGSAALARSVAGAATAAGVPRVVLASSIYARMDEDGRVNTYGAGKRASEQVFLQAKGFATVILRLPPVYGPGAKGGIAMLEALVRRRLPLPFGRATALRDYLAVGNLAALITALAQAEAAAFAGLAGRAYEPSDGAPIATRELAREIGTAVGKPVVVLPVPPTMLTVPAMLVGRAAQVEAVFAPLRCRDDSDLRQATGWQPEPRYAVNLTYLS